MKSIPKTSGSQQNVFNLFKGLACICVVFIHVRFPGIVGDVIWKLSQYAVPTFLMISGYFAIQKDEIIVKNVYKRFLRFFSFRMPVFYLSSASEFGKSFVHGLDCTQFQFINSHQIHRILYNQYCNCPLVLNCND